MCLIGSLSCEEDRVEANGSVTVDTTDSGVVWVTNRGRSVWERDSGRRWKVEEVVRIGTVEGSGPEAFGRVGATPVDARGRVWIADVQASELRVFDEQGRFVRTVGRRGEGPGEFGRIGPIFNGPAGPLWVEDLSLGRWEVFDTSGARVGGHPVSSRLAGAFRRWTRDGRFLVLDTHPGQPERGIIRVFRMEDGELVEQSTRYDLPEPPAPPVLTFVSRGGRGEISVPVPFAPTPWATLDAEGSWWLAEGDGTYQFRRQSLAGDTLVSVQRSFQPVAISDSVRRAALEGLRERFEGSVPATALDLDVVPRTYPAFERGFVADDGTVWIRRVTGPAHTGLDVFTGDGVYLGLAETPEELGAMRIGVITDSLIIAVATDELGVDHVVRFAIRK